MKNRLFFLFISTAFLTHNLEATEYDNYRRFSNMNKEAQEKVKGKAQELIQAYDAQKLPADAIKEHRDALADNIKRLEALLQQCKEGTIAPELAKGCENENTYVLVHVFKLLLQHIEQKIKAELSPAGQVR